MRSALRRAPGRGGLRRTVYGHAAPARLGGGWMPCGATVRRPWWSCSTAIAPTNMPRASWPISWRHGDSCPWLRPVRRRALLLHGALADRCGAARRGRLCRGRGLRARRGGENCRRRGAGDRCEEVADRAQRDALDVAVRAVRTRLPPQSKRHPQRWWSSRPGRQVHALWPLCETLPDGEPSSPATSFVPMRRSVSAAVLASRDVPSAHAATILPSHPCCRAISRNASATSRSCRACTTRKYETGTSGSGLFSCRFGVVELYSVPSGCSSRIMSRNRTPSSTIGWS